MRPRDFPWRRAARQLAQPAHVAPRLLSRALRQVDVPPVALISVYRAKHAPVLEQLLRRLPPDSEVALWALDEPSSALERRTVGSGPGTRTELLNRLSRHVTADRTLLVADDDVAISGRDLRLFLRASRAAGLDLAQPAHLARSYTSWPFVRQRLFTYVRLTRFVEQGPLMALSPRGVRECFPLPEELGMGWGLEALWARLADGRLRLGIVDAAGMRHLSPVSAGYDRGEQEARGRATLAATSFSSFSELQVTNAAWVMGRPRPAWVTVGA